MIRPSWKERFRVGGCLSPRKSAWIQILGPGMQVNEVYAATNLCFSPSPPGHNCLLAIQLGEIKCCVEALLKSN